MHYNFNTLKNLREAIDSLIQKFGENTYIGTQFVDKQTDEKLISEVTMLNVVYIDCDGKVVGDEANDYSPKEKELLAIEII